MDKELAKIIPRFLDYAIRNIMVFFTEVVSFRGGPKN
jgi:hypothetical protein